jgi:hypothetical protein
MRASPVALEGAGQQAGIGGVILVVAHIDDRGRVGQADQTGKLCDGDVGVRRHGVHSNG